MKQRRRYYFTDSSFASDTIISYVLGGIALALDASGIVASIVTAGHVPAVFGILYICAILLAITGQCFAAFGKKAHEGGVKGKRVSVALNWVALLIPVGIILMGIFGK